MKILVLCTGNSCRSQMAHGFLNSFGCIGLEVYSAGVETHGVNPKAIQVMNEVGVDISSYTSNHIDEYRSINFDYMITVCDHAREVCPYVPTTTEIIHESFPDPAKAGGTDDQVLNEYRRTRDLIQEYCAGFIIKIDLLTN